LYLYNAKDGMLKTKFDDVLDASDAKNTREFAGVVDTYYVKDLLGFVPPNHQKSISIILVENEGDDRFPLTPWMVAHRVIHALLISQSPSTGRALLSAMNEFLRMLMYNVLGHQVMQILGAERAALEIVKYIGTTKAQRSGNLPNTGEILVEMGTQYIATGRISFRDINFNDPKGSRYFISADEDKARLINKFIQGGHEEFEALFDELLAKNVGKCIIL
jgi:hypothetical protein